MKIREYISQKLRAWNITDAQLEDISSSIDLDEEYTSDNSQVVGKAMISVIEELMLAPYMSNVNENGFSVSWDYSRIGQYYMWLCRKYGVAPDDEVVAALGLSTITDKSDIW
jgi:hypothetical protein